MSEKSAIEDRLRRKEAEIQALEDRLRSARIYVQALRDVIKDISGPNETVHRSGTMITQVRDAIKEAGRPLHVSELLRAIGRNEDSKNSLTGSLAAYVRKGEIFTRPAPNTFGLIELGHKPQDDQPDDFEPPATFGASSRRPVAFDDDLTDDVPF